jgi:hypothetical protein
MDTSNKSTQLPQDSSTIVPPPTQMSQPTVVATNATVSVQKDATQQSVPKPEQPEKTIKEPEQPISGPGKEFGSIPAADVKEYILPAQPEVKLPSEIKEAGVSPSPNTEQPRIQSDASNPSPIVLAKESVPVQTNPQGIIQLPMQEEKAVEVVKTSKPMESIRWLATLIIEQAKRAHKLLKPKV